MLTVTQMTQNIWNFMVGKSSLQEIATLAVIREIPDSNLETSGYGPKSGVSRIIRKSWTWTRPTYFNTQVRELGRLFLKLLSLSRKKTKMLFTGLGRSVFGETVPSVWVPPSAGTQDLAARVFGLRPTKRNVWLRTAIVRKLASNRDGQILHVTLWQSVYLETPNLKPA